jgi:Flp pilus assembly protein TadB
MGDFLRWLVGLFGSGSSAPAPDPADPCNAAECGDAKHRVASARSKFKSICDALTSLKFVGDALQGEINSPIWVLAAVLAVVALIGWLLGSPQIAGVAGVLAVVVLAVWAVSWLLLWVVGKMSEALAPELLKQQQAVRDGVRDVVANCQANCQGNISIPLCPLG